MDEEASSGVVMRVSSWGKEAATCPVFQAHRAPGSSYPTFSPLYAVTLMSWGVGVESTSLVSFAPPTVGPFLTLPDLELNSAELLSPVPSSLPQSATL